MIPADARTAAAFGTMPNKWVILIACTFGTAVTISPIFYNTLPVFTLSIAQGTGWGRAAIVSAISVATLTAVLTSPFTGRLIDRFGPRRILGYGHVLFGLSMAALGFFHQTYAIYILVAVIIGLFGNMASIWVWLSVLPRWFDRNLGLSLGIASTGLAFGQVLTPLLASTLVTDIGWEMAYVALALVATFVALICVMFLRDNPPGGSSKQAGTHSQTVADGLTRAQAMRTPAFWRLVASVLLVTMAVGGCLLTMVPFLQDHGLSLQLAARAAAVAGVAGMVGRLFTGFVLDRVDASLLAAVTFVVAAGAITLLWLNTSASSYFFIAALLGLALGAEGDVVAYITRRTFGARAYGELYGFIWAAFNCGVLLGPLLLGLSYDRFNSYDPALFLLIGSALVAALLMVLNGAASLTSVRGLALAASGDANALASKLSEP